jgi:hypothetical protein
MPRTLVLIACVVLVGCGRPALVISHNRDRIVVDMQSLGEYPSDVARLRLHHARKGVVWDLRGHDFPQAGRVELVVGANPVQMRDVRHGRYDVLVPRGSQTFTIEAGERYVIEIWGDESKPWTRNTDEFVAPKRSGSVWHLRPAGCDVTVGHVSLCGAAQDGVAV